MNAKPQIQQLFGDDPILDILHIAYNDLLLGRVTRLAKLNNLMRRTYPEYDEKYISAIIRVITVDNSWFKPRRHTVTNEPCIHLQERGVELYLNMLQIRRAEQIGESADAKAELIVKLTYIVITLTVLSVIIAVVTIFIK